MARLRIGDYQVEHELAVGRSSQLFRGIHTVLPRHALIKVAREAQDSVAVLREACILAALPHPGIVRVFETGRLADHRTWFAHEIVEGLTLQAMFHSLPGTGDQIIDPATAVAMLRDVAEILAYAHQRGVIHCAIAPEKLVVSRGRGFAMCITDWSAARAHDATTPYAGELGPFTAPELRDGDPVASPALPGEAAPRHRGAESVASPALPGEAAPRHRGAESVASPALPGEAAPRHRGAESVASPALPGEAAPRHRGAESIDDRVDVFALGVVAYRTLTGRMPAATPIPTEVHCPDVPRELTMLVDQMLSHDRWDRPSAAEARADLAWLATSLADKSGPSEVVRVRKPRWTPEVEMSKTLRSQTESDPGILPSLSRDDRD